MIATPFHPLRFSAIKHRLPPDCWAVRRNEYNDGEFEHELVLFHEGDLQLERLDLDMEPNEDGEYPFLVLIAGGLRVDGPISNENTDGATGLVVLGDLHARDMVVGGQEVYVTGHLHVDGLFWGDYNHGELVVEGDVTAALLIDTDQYRLNIAGRLKASRHMGQWDDQDQWQDLETHDPVAFMEPDCLLDDEDGMSLDRAEILARLRTGRPVFRAESLAPAPPLAIALAFPDTSIAPSNIDRLASAAWLPALAPDAVTSGYEFWQGNTFCRVTAFGPAAQENAFRIVYLQGEDYAARLRTDRARTAEGAPAWMFAVHVRPVGEDDAPWQPCGPDSPEPIRAFIGAAWMTLLGGMSTFEHARGLIAAEEVHALLALPIAAPYDDFYDDDRTGFWAGPMFCSFRREGERYEGEPQPAMLRLVREYADDGSGEERREVFLYTVQRQLDGSECVVIGYRPAEDDSSVPFSYVASSEALQRAVQMFRRGQRLLLRYNARLLAGDVPYVAEPFAYRYWREQGYLKGSPRPDQ